MQPLNAIDAISPAFTRAHALLLPFRAGRSWKLAATSYLAFTGSWFVPFPLAIVLVPHFAQQAHLLYAAAVGLTLLILLLLYPLVRLGLVDFEMVVTQEKMIAPMWRRYARKVWPWLGLEVLLGTLSFAAILPTILATVRHAMASFSGEMLGAKPDPAQVARFMQEAFGAYFLVVSLLLLPKIVATVFNDFVLPVFVLEDLPLREACARGLRTFASDPIACVLYLVTKFVLSIFGYVMQSIALQLCMIPVILVGGILVGLGFLIHSVAGPNAHLPLIVAGVLLALALYAVLFYLTIGAIGYVTLVLDCYAVYFVGSRYPALGNLLEPPTQAYTGAPPPSIPPALV